MALIITCPNNLSSKTGVSGEFIHGTGSHARKLVTHGRNSLLSHSQGVPMSPLVSTDVDEDVGYGDRDTRQDIAALNVAQLMKA